MWTQIKNEMWNKIHSQIESINELNKINQIVVKSNKNKSNQRNKTRTKVTFDENICYFNERNNKQIVSDFDSFKDNDRFNREINSKYFWF
jgi:hypothetical protein